MSRDLRLQELLPPERSPFFDYTSDAFRFFVDDDTQDLIHALHRGIVVHLLQQQSELGEALSAISPQTALAFEHTLWTPVKGEGSVTLDPAPIDVLGVKETLSAASDWLTTTYNPATGVLGGLPTDGKTYWIPEMRFANSYVTRFLAQPIGLHAFRLPRTMPQERLPHLIALVEWALMQGSTERALRNVAAALAGHPFHLSGTARFNPTVSSVVSVAADGPAERQWHAPRRIELSEASRRKIRLVDPLPEAVPLQRGVIRIPSQSYTSPVIVRYVKGPDIFLEGSVPEVALSDWAIFQLEAAPPRPVSRISVQVQMAAGEQLAERRSAVEFFLRHMVSGSAKLLLELSP
jgi:hypothetical protein